MPWDPQLRNMLPVHAEVMAMMDFGADAENNIDTDPPPDDAILAAYLMPKIAGFEEQDELFRKLQEQGLIGRGTEHAPDLANLGIPTMNPKGVVVFDPMNGLNMPRL